MEAAAQPETMVLPASITEHKTGAVLIDKTEGGAVLRILLVGDAPYNKTLTFSARGGNLTVGVDEDDIRAATYYENNNVPDIATAPLLTERRKM